MALTAEETQIVSELLGEHPDWRTTQIREAAGLPPKQLFAVKTLRNRLGVPEPDAGDLGSPPHKPSRRVRGTRRSSSSQSQSQSVGDGFDELEASDIGEMVPPARKSAAGRKAKSILAPMMPDLIEAATEGVYAFTARITRGVHPMPPPAARSSVAVPALRIADRTLAKYVKLGTGKVSENQRDAGMIGFALAMWLLGWLISSATRKAQNASGGGTQTHAAQHGPTPETVAAFRAAARQYEHHIRPDQDGDRDGGDLYAGSEPIAKEAADGGGPAMRRVPSSSGPANAVRAGDDVWNAISPTNMGNWEAAG